MGFALEKARQKAECIPAMICIMVARGFCALDLRAGVGEYKYVYVYVEYHLVSIPLE